MLKAPTKVGGVTGDKFVQSMTKISQAYASRGLLLQACKEFADLLAIDNEVKVAAEADDDDEGRLRTPSGDDEGDTIVLHSAGSKASKRRGSISMLGTPHKKKRVRPPLGVRRKSTKSVGDEENSS